MWSDVFDLKGPLLLIIRSIYRYCQYFSILNIIIRCMYTDDQLTYINHIICNRVSLCTIISRILKYWPYDWTSERSSFNETTRVWIRDSEYLYYKVTYCIRSGTKGRNKPWLPSLTRFVILRRVIMIGCSLLIKIVVDRRQAERWTKNEEIRRSSLRAIRETRLTGKVRFVRAR